MLFQDKRPALSGSADCTFHADDIAGSQDFRKRYATLPNVVAAEDMPWERSPDGLIKHLVHPRIRQASAHVGGDHFRGRGGGLRPALGHAVRLP
jgi:hypothetical protein